MHVGVFHRRVEFLQVRHIEKSILVDEAGTWHRHVEVLLGVHVTKHQCFIVQLRVTAHGEHVGGCTPVYTHDGWRVVRDDRFVVTDMGQR